MAINEQKMLQAIYDTLFSAFTSPPAGASGQGGSNAPNTYLNLNWPGLPIDTADFANPFNPTTNTGSQLATEKLSQLVDKIPLTEPMYNTNGNNVSMMYEQILNATVTPPPENPEQKAAYEKALNYLQADGTDFDDEGNKITVKVDSPVYANYKRKKSAYNNAVAAMMANYFQFDMTKPQDQNKWSLLGPTYVSTVTTAWNDWTNANKTKVEDNLATLAQSSNNQVGQTFAKARQQFAAMERASVIDPNASYYPAYAFPSNWCSTTASDGWTTVTIDSGSMRINEKSDFSAANAGAKASWGLWSAGGSFSSQSSHQSMDQETNNLKVSFKFCRVDVNRPWLNFSLCRVGNWSTTAYDKDKLSNGTKNQPSSPFPLMPTGFIAIKDLQISAQWGKKDQEAISKAISTKASFGWGPFAVSGGYQSSSSSKKFSSSFENNTIKTPGLQIIGWINTVVPACPPMSAVKSNVAANTMKHLADAH